MTDIDPSKDAARRRYAEDVKAYERYWQQCYQEDPSRPIITLTRFLGLRSRGEI